MPSSRFDQKKVTGKSTAITKMPRMKRGFRGLYGNRMIQFGNKKSFAENKTRRTWKPNVHRVSLYSEALDGVYKFRITSHALRDVRKFGGLDGYLLNTRDSEIKYPVALRLKQCVKVMHAAQVLPKDTIIPEQYLDDSAQTETSVPGNQRGLKHLEKPLIKRVGLQQVL